MVMPFKSNSLLPLSGLFLRADEQQALNSIMQDLAVLHKASRPVLPQQETGKPKSSSPKKQVIFNILTNVLNMECPAVTSVIIFLARPVSIPG